MLFTPQERGQGLTEYAFLISLVVIVVIVVLYLFGVSVEELYDYTIGRLVDAFT
jgi:pilus assembly protein Flp/PilA